MRGLAETECPASLTDHDAHILQLLRIGGFNKQVSTCDGKEGEQADGDGEREHGCLSFLATRWGRGLV